MFFPPGFACGRLDFEDSILNGQERDIESDSTHVVVAHVPLTTGFDRRQWLQR
jgi:hypothetical protein